MRHTVKLYGTSRADLGLLSYKNQRKGPVGPLLRKTVASDVLDGYRIGITSTHYHTTSVDPFWTEHFELDGMIGNHLFYTNTTQYR